MTRRDAAFVAYAGLRAAGLVNDNLLSMPQMDKEAEKAYSEIMKRPSSVQVEPQPNPWCEVLVPAFSPSIFGCPIFKSSRTLHLPLS